MGAQIELAGIMDGTGRAGGTFSSTRCREEVLGGAVVMVYLIRTDNRETISIHDQKHKKTTYLASFVTNGALASVFAFFPLPCPPLYGSVCIVLRLVFVLAPITLAVSDHEPWLGATFFGFGKTCGWGDPAKRRSRRWSNCCRESDICCGGESWLRMARL